MVNDWAHGPSGPACSDPGYRCKSCEGWVFDPPDNLPLCPHCGFNGTGRESRLIAFYKGLGSDADGRFVDEVWGARDADKERWHSYIQWLFPLPEPSLAQPQSPVLTAEELEAFRTDSTLQGNARVSLLRMREFYDRTPQWTRARDHNHLRITRILRFLTLIGLKTEAQDFFDWLMAQDTQVPEHTRWYWREALGENPAWLVQDGPPRA